MSSQDLLAARIDRLESRFAIAELVTDYAVACDEHDMGKLMGLFTEDAAFDSPSGAMVANGRAAIEAMFIDLFKVRGPAFHWTHDHTVRFAPDSNDHASGIVLAHAETCPSDVVSLAAMRYHDEYRREGGRWFIARREIRFLYYVPVTEYSTALKSRNRLTMRGERLPADYPENLAVWQAFDATYKVSGR